MCVWFFIHETKNVISGPFKYVSLSSVEGGWRRRLERFLSVGLMKSFKIKLSKMSTKGAETQPAYLVTSQD